MILGQLRSMGYQIIRARVREALRSVDPINTALRWQEGSRLEEVILFQDPIHYGILVSYIDALF